MSFWKSFYISNDMFKSSDFMYLMSLLYIAILMGKMSKFKVA